MRSRTSASRANRSSRVGSLRSCASVKSADTQYSARWSLQEQVFSSGFTNIAFHKVSKRKIRTQGTGRSTGVVGRKSKKILRLLLHHFYDHNILINVLFKSIPSEILHVINQVSLFYCQLICTARTRPIDRLSYLNSISVVYLYFSFTFKGELVVVKHIKKKELRISRKILIEVKQVTIELTNQRWSELQSNLSPTVTLGTEKSGLCGEVAVMGRQGGNKTSKVHNIRYEYRRQFIYFLPAEYTWNTIKIRIPRLLNHHRATRIKSHGHS